MQRNANRKIDEYVSGYKSEVKNKLISLGDGAKISDMLDCVLDYPRLELEPADFVRRRRAQNSVADDNRCLAKTGQGLQCKCRRILNKNFCGTHIKGSPNGVVSDSLKVSSTTSTVLVEVSSCSIQGIIYYIDSDLNVFRPEDVLRGLTDPAIVARAVRLDDGSLSIAESGAEQEQT